MKACPSLDRAVLVGNLVSGALWLLPLAFTSWPLALIGAVYVVAAGLFLAAMYARNLTTRLEVVAWVVPWVAAVAVWTVILVGIEFGASLRHFSVSLSVGVLIGTLCYAGWQIVALPVRLFVSGRSGGPSLSA